MNDICIKFEPKDLSVIRASLSEYGGGSAYAMSSISGLSTELVKNIIYQVDACWEGQDVIDDNGEFINLDENGFLPPLTLVSDTITLSEEEWKMVYDSINAMIYALGPFELELIWCKNPLEVLDTNLKICVAVWGAYGGLKWTDKYESKFKDV